MFKLLAATWAAQQESLGVKKWCERKPGLQGTQALRQQGRMMHGFRKFLRNGARSPSRATYVIRALACGVPQTAERLWRTGQIRSSQCLLWSAECDDVYHRLFECPSPAAVEIRQQLPDGWQEELQAAGRNHAAATYFWSPKPKRWRLPDSIDVVFLSPCLQTTAKEQFGAFEAGKPIFTDGSCLFPKSGILATAAAAAVQVTEKGALIRAAVATVPAYMPASSAWAEHLAVWLAAKYSVDGAPTIVTDYQGVIQYSSNRLESMSPRKPFSGLWMEIWRLVPRAVFKKTKAHRDKYDAEYYGDLHNFNGNDYADSQARAEARRTGPDEKTVSLVQDAELATETLVKWAARMLCLWPTFREAVDTGQWTVVSSSKRGRNRGPATPHDWQWSAAGSRFVCSACMRWSRRPALSIGKCKWAAAETSRVVMSAHATHVLRRLVSVRHASVVFCERCGVFTETHLRSLLQPCLGKPANPTAKSRLGRMSKGRHPVKDLFFQHFRVFRPVEAGPDPVLVPVMPEEVPPCDGPRAWRHPSAPSGEVDDGRDLAPMPAVQCDEESFGQCAEHDSWSLDDQAGFFGTQ